MSGSLSDVEKEFLKHSKKLREIWKLEAQSGLEANQLAKVASKQATLDTLATLVASLPGTSELAQRNPDIFAALPDTVAAPPAPTPSAEICADGSASMSGTTDAVDKEQFVLGEGQGGDDADAFAVAAAMAEAAKKENTPVGSFWASCDGVRISDTMNCLGLLALPVVGRYPYVDMWDAETKIAIRGGSGGLPALLPEPIQKELEKLGGPDCVSRQEFFVVAQDVSRLVANTGLPCSLNVLLHAWAYPTVAPGTRCGYGDPWSMGVFTFEGSGVQPLDKVDMAFQMLSPSQVHIHPQRGGMCCSPNNGRIQVTGTTKVCWFWSAAFRPASEEEMQPARVCVALHWLLLEPSPALDAALAASSDVPELLKQLSQCLGHEQPYVAAVQQAFGMVGARPPTALETPKMPSTRPGPLTNGGGGGNGSKGVGDGGGSRQGGKNDRSKGGKGGRGGKSGYAR